MTSVAAAKLKTPSAHVTVAVTPSTEDMAAVIIDLTRDDDDDDEEEEEKLCFLGAVDFSVVGIRYYAGAAHPGEYVSLIREPKNPYDRNAVRVDNLRGEKVGHVKREQAAALAPIMDTMPCVKVDATIPCAGNQWNLPLKVEFYGQSPEQSIIIEQLVRDRIGQRAVHNFTTTKRTNSAARAQATVVVQKKTIDWKAQQAQLDDMFEQQLKLQLANLPEWEKPSTLTVDLFDHQVEGIRWMIHCESGKTKVPFFKQVEEKGKTMWLSEITNSSQVTPPKPVCGGILADDMGLGKTIQALGLMLYNTPNGRDYEAGGVAPQTSTPITTLIVCPVSVISNWMSQVESHVKPETLRVETYHGPNRHALLEDLNSIDILIASYNTIAYDFSQFEKHTDKENSKNGQKPQKKKAKTAMKSLFELVFHRILLDEAHIIRSTNTCTFRACSSLKAERRFCLTGTPLQNRPDDIHSLFSFLKLEPLGDKEVFRRAISQPIQAGDECGLSRLRAMMAHIALRRSKSIVKIDMADKEVQLRSVEFPDGPHKTIHHTLFRTAQVAFQATLLGGDAEALKNYMSILEMLLRVRQACCSGVLLPKERLERAEQVLKELEHRGANPLTADEGKVLMEKLKGTFETEEVECSVCLCEMEESVAIILRSCSHVFCQTCIARVGLGGHGLCPLCRKKFNASDMISASQADKACGEEPAPTSQSLEGLEASPKVNALLEAISEMKTDEKGVIFSQFTSFLDEIEKHLRANAHTFTRIDGKKTSRQRIEAMKVFSSETDGPKLMLCSLHACGTGVNLTRANHCFMMDTWWNSAVENQAMDRVHRIGQKRNVRVVRFVMAKSIEERMIELQESKAALGKGALEKLKPEEIRKARIGHLKNLFDLKLTE